MPKSDSMQPYTMKFEPAGSEGTCLADESLLTCAQTLGINVTAFCNGTGTCRACAIRITQGAVSEPTSIERNTFPENALREGWRLACQTFPRSECQLFLPETSQRTSQRLQTEGDERHVTLCPPVRSVQIELEPPSRDEVHTDAENLRQAIKQQHGFDVHILDIELLRTLSADLRALRWQCNAYLRQRELIGVTAPTSRTLGVAVDLGTTKIAGYVVDLSNGKTLAARGFMNPQIRYGEEIISRLQYALQAPSGEKTLQKILIEALNQLIRELCEEIGSHRSEIVESVIVGNTAMHHILLKLPVRQLAMAPFVPALRSAFDVKARDIGLHIASGANLHVLPNIAGFVGADHTAALVATAEEWKQGKVLVLDIGTNTEASLTIDGKISSLSCASGPAFEGFHIKDGMRSAPGAIEKVWFHKEEVCYETVAGTQ
ncbi:MAG: DUF4445 domain-containing protein, partial [bacterium]|nr:DUF4445 domain-containing protein [bacterium]